MAHQFKNGDTVYFRVSDISGTGTIVGKAVSELPVLGSSYIVKLDKPIEIDGETQEYLSCFAAWMEPFTAPLLEAGEHLRIIRSWIQWKCFNGSSVTWGSNDTLKFTRDPTVSEMEALAQNIANAVKRKKVVGKEDTGFFPLLVRYSDSREKIVVNLPSEIQSGKSFTVLETNYKE